MNSGNIEYVNLEELSQGDYRVIDGETDITGWPVIDESEVKIGKVRDLLFDPEQNAIRYIIVDLDSAIVGDEDKAILIPIGYANLGNDKKEVVVPVIESSQYLAMPRYIIGEVTRDTEVQIRSALDSAATSPAEAESAEIPHTEFYRHHHFDRGNVVAPQHQTHEAVAEVSTTNRVEEERTIEKLIDRAETHSFVAQEIEPQHTTPHERFSVNTTDGTFDIEPQENGTYRIFDQENKIGVIYAEAGEEGVQWRTMDQLGTRFVTMIGEAITVHNDASTNL